MIRVYQVQLTNSMINEINEKGWGNTSFDSNYFALTNFPGRGATVDEQLLKAVADGLVSHTMTIDTDEMGEVYDIGNGYGDRSKIVYSAVRRKSVSVGDLLVNDEGDGYVVAPVGFDPVERMTVRKMETQVSTRMMLA